MLLSAGSRNQLKARFTSKACTPSASPAPSTGNAISFFVKVIRTSFHRGSSIPTDSVPAVIIMMISHLSPPISWLFQPVRKSLVAKKMQATTVSQRVVRFAFRRSAVAPATRYTAAAARTAPPISPAPAFSKPTLAESTATMSTLKPSVEECTTKSPFRTD